MRVDLNSDPAAFVKQVAQLRRNLNRLEAAGDGDGIKARLMLVGFVPFLNAIRTELRAKSFLPSDVLESVAELMGNLAATTIQSMFNELPEDQRHDLASRMTAKAFDALSHALLVDGDLAITTTSKLIPVQHAAAPEPQPEPEPEPTNVLKFPKSVH